MQPARRLLSLLFLILMGTNSPKYVHPTPFPPCVRGARPARSRQSRGAAPHSSAPPTPAPARARPRDWGGDQLHLGCRRCRLIPDCCCVPQDLGPDPFLLDAWLPTPC